MEIEFFYYLQDLGESAVMELEPQCGYFSDVQF